MSQFDFPRINFSGKASINPSTANNNLLLPLVTYDPIRAKVILPPRVYLSNDLRSLHTLGGLPIPVETQVYQDKQNSFYIEIEPINSKEKYLKWVIDPLGKCPLDKSYHDLYKIVMSRRTGKPISGGLPASWNFYGGMEFSFEDVNISGVAHFDDKKGQHIYTKKDHDLSHELTEILDSKLEMTNERGQSSAVMIDVLPSLAMYSQVFCDSLSLKSGENILMKGKPTKGSLRFFNPSRVVNETGVLAASGSFFSVIPLENLSESENSVLFKYFKKYCKINAVLKGIFIRYNLSQIWENQEIDYEKHGKFANPAKALLIGSLSPYFENDLTSIGYGRQLIPVNPYFENAKIASFVFRLSEGGNFLSMDLLGSIPTFKTNSQKYETFEVGTLDIIIEKENTDSQKVAEFEISSRTMNLEKIILSGGLVEIPFNLNTYFDEAHKSNFLLSRNGVTLMRESQYMIVTDQAGLYATENEDQEGFICNDIERENCCLKIYERGKPLKGAIAITVMELKIEGVGNLATVSEYIHKGMFRNNQILELPKDKAMNAMYVFYPNPSEVISKDLISEIHRSGFFVSLRVLPKKNYGKYLDPRNQEYPKAVTFEVLYNEVLSTYDYIFPVASEITPFTEDYFKKGARFVKYRMSPENWEKATYMPSSRDMSNDQWLLFCKWFEGLELD